MTRAWLSVVPVLLLLAVCGGSGDADTITLDTKRGKIEGKVGRILINDKNI